jgi:WD40 repeat protein
LQPFTDQNEESDAMAPHFSGPQDQDGISRIHEGGVVRGSTSQVPRLSLRQLARTVTAIVALGTLTAWWDRSATTSPENVIGTHPDRLMAMAIAPEGRWLATGGYHGSVLIWDVARKRIETELQGADGPVFGLDYSPDGSLLAAVRFDGSVRVWKTRSWEVSREFRADSRTLNCLAFSPDARLLATGSVDGTVILWDTSTWQSRGVLQGHGGVVNYVRFSPDGRTLASSSADATVRLWNVDSLRTDRVIRALPGEKDLPIRRLAFTPDGKVLATLRAMARPVLWDTATGSRRATIGEVDGLCSTLECSPDGRTLALGSVRGEIDLRDVGNGKRLSILRAHSDKRTKPLRGGEDRALFTGRRRQQLAPWSATPLVA